MKGSTWTCNEQVGFGLDWQITVWFVGLVGFCMGWWVAVLFCRGCQVGGKGLNLILSHLLIGSELSEVSNLNLKIKRVNLNLNLLYRVQVSWQVWSIMAKSYLIPQLSYLNKMVTKIFSWETTLCNLANFDWKHSPNSFLPKKGSWALLNKELQHTKISFLSRAQTFRRDLYLVNLRFFTTGDSPWLLPFRLYIFFY